MNTAQGGEFEQVPPGFTVPFSHSVHSFIPGVSGAEICGRLVPPLICADQSGETQVVITHIYLFFGGGAFWYIYEGYLPQTFDTSRYINAVVHKLYKQQGQEEGEGVFMWHRLYWDPDKMHWTPEEGVELKQPRVHGGIPQGVKVSPSTALSFGCEKRMV